LVYIGALSYVVYSLLKKRWPFKDTSTI
jgi:hypothetical protein